jgi:lactoylglutathione lyase/glyoxylase I family protein
VVADLERALAFYVDQLGCTPGFEFINDQGCKYGQYVHVGGRNFIELFQRELLPRAEKQSYQHLCLEVADFDLAVKTLQERGVEVANIKLGMDRSHQAWIVDPDGNRIELHGYTPESKQNGWL